MIDMQEFPALPKKVMHTIESKFPLLIAILPTGSHLWGCPSKGADIDIIVVFKYPLPQYAGLGPLKTTKVLKVGRFDVVGYELRYFCERVLSNNLNFVIAALSKPLLVQRRYKKDWSEIYAVARRAISAQKICPQIFSIVHNQIKAIQSERLDYKQISKKYLLVVRYLSFGINFVKTDRISFDFLDTIWRVMDDADWQTTKRVLNGEQINPTKLLHIIKKYERQLKDRLTNKMPKKIPLTLISRIDRVLCGP